MKSTVYEETLLKQGHYVVVALQPQLWMAALGCSLSSFAMNTLSEMHGSHATKTPGPTFVHLADFCNRYLTAKYDIEQTGYNNVIQDVSPIINKCYRKCLYFIT